MVFSLSFSGTVINLDIRVFRFLLTTDAIFNHGCKPCHSLLSFSETFSIFASRLDKDRALLFISGISRTSFLRLSIAVHSAGYEATKCPTTLPKPQH